MLSARRCVTASGGRVAAARGLEVALAFTFVLPLGPFTCVTAAVEGGGCSSRVCCEKLRFVDVLHPDSECTLLKPADSTSSDDCRCEVTA